MLPSTSWIALALVFIISRVVKIRADKQKVKGLPGLQSLFSPAHLIGALLPTFFLNPGLSWQWYWRNQIYERAEANTISVLSWLFGDPTVYTRSLEVARQVLSTRGSFEKPYESAALLSLWGPNLFSANGGDWRRHRRIMAPAFSVDTYKHVWAEASSLFGDMVEAEGWSKQEQILLSPVNEITTKFALNIISRCAFGSIVTWRRHDEVPVSSKSDADSMDFGEALGIVSHASIVRMITPRWMYKLPIKRLVRIEAAYKSLQTFMAELIATRKSELSSGDAVVHDLRHDLFSLMVGMSQDEGAAAMSDEELAGNTFLMLFAGHETTARTLDAVLGYLAWYPKIQEEVYQEIQSVYSEDSSFPFDAASKLQKTQSCFLEAARMFPAVFMMIRRTTEDIVLTTDDAHIHNGRLALEKGTTVIVDTVGLHYNPKYFPEPEEFRPSRWYDALENDMTMFSVGSRACIGRRFALTEGVCFLAHLLHKWRLETILKAGETREQWGKRVMVADVGMTLGVGRVPVKMISREVKERS